MDELAVMQSRGHPSGVFETKTLFARAVAGSGATVESMKSGAQRAVGRPRDFDEDRILDQAVELFWAHGAAGTTTRMLEAELGLTQSSIYNAFGSKAGLLDRAVDRYMEQIDCAVVSPLDADDVGPEHLFRFIDDLKEWISQPGREGCMLLNMLAEDATAEPQLIARAHDYRDRMRHAFHAALEPLDAAAANQRAELVLAAVLGINVVARSGARDGELDALAAGLADQIRIWEQIA